MEVYHNELLHSLKCFKDYLLKLCHLKDLQCDLRIKISKIIHKKNLK